MLLLVIAVSPLATKHDAKAIDIGGLKTLQVKRDIPPCATKTFRMHRYTEMRITRQFAATTRSIAAIMRVTSV